MMAAATACAFLPIPGFHESSYRSLNWRTHKKPLVRKAKVTAKFELNPLPYPMNALEPHMSRTTFEYHWRKHHRTYVDNLNKQIVGTQLDEFTLEDIILTTYNKGNLLPPFNNAAQNIFFYLTTLCLQKFTSENAPEVPEGTLDKEHFMIVEAWKHSDFLCKNYILSGLQDDLYSVYSGTKTSVELWGALE
ncbi:Superoxide dismutase [Fe] 2, chloroplastic [Capsicum annuum]|nr:Superoxide dismutase [Fe] 2, chloroplastic [Capsicum annuum]